MLSPRLPRNENATNVRLQLALIITSKRPLCGKGIFSSHFPVCSFHLEIGSVGYVASVSRGRIYHRKFDASVKIDDISTANQDWAISSCWSCTALQLIPTFDSIMKCRCKWYWYYVFVGRRSLQSTGFLFALLSLVAMATAFHSHQVWSNQQPLDFDYFSFFFFSFFFFFFCYVCSFNLQFRFNVTRVDCPFQDAVLTDAYLRGIMNRLGDKMADVPDGYLDYPFARSLNSTVINSIRFIR